MNKTSLPFLLIIGLYLGFEAFTASRAAYRLEPLYIFDQLVSAERAMTRCGAPEEQTLAQFRGTLGSITRKALAELAASDGSAAGEASTAGTAALSTEQIIQARQRERQQEVDALIEIDGCNQPEITKLKQRFAIYARRRLV